MLNFISFHKNTLKPMKSAGIKINTLFSKKKD